MHLRHYGIDDAYDLDAMFAVYDDYENIFGKFSFGETFEFTDSGKYFVKAVNRFGWSESFSIIISRNAPVINAEKTRKIKDLIFRSAKAKMNSV